MILLNTKLHIPPKRSAWVYRETHIQALNRLTDYKLALIAAPAGYGKTAFVSEWAQQTTFDVAWLSLDAQDNDPVRFWNYVIGAIQTASPQTAEKTLPLMQEPNPLPIENFLSVLGNELASLPNPFALVLDDYHDIETSIIHKELEFFIECLPPSVHLIIITRSDPPLPLARMRARHQLLELHTSDLRFSGDEIVTFFNTVMGLSLKPDELTDLDKHIEGWVAGLQLAGLALQGHDHRADFIASFAGDHRDVVDYLGDEILDRQPESVQKFLLETSILEHLSADLCDTLTGASNSQTVLEHLERHHFFVMPVDDHREWYRYHPLFAEFLRHQLGLKYPRRTKELHLKASYWCEHNGLPLAAINHALAASDDEHTATLVQGIGEFLIWQRTELNTLLGWLNAMPNTVVRQNPRLCLYHAWILYLTNQMHEAEERVRDAENALKSNDNVRDPLAAGMLAAVRSSITGIHQQFSITLPLARQALKQLPHEAVSWRCVASINLGITCAAVGEMHEAIDVLEFAVELSYELGSSFAILSAFWHLSSLQTNQLLLRDAEKTCHQLEMASQRPGLHLFQTDGYTALMLGEIMLERNQTDEAERYLLKSVDQINPEGFPMALVRTYVALARLKAIQGDTQSAEYYFDRSEQIERTHKLYGRVSALSVYRIRRWLQEGNWDATERWVAQNRLGLDDEWTFHREPYYLMLARYYITRDNQVNKAMPLLERIRHRAEADNRTGSLIRALILQALALDTQEDDQQAVEVLSHALSIASLEQPIRVFADEGKSLATLLEKVLNLQRKGKLKLSIPLNYLLLLRATLDEQTSPAAPIARTLLSGIENLSERELEVLRLLAEGLNSGDIAERLNIAVETARKHIKNIYAKLDVHNRWQAIKRAEELTLL